MAEMRGEKPLWFVTLPSHPKVCVQGQYHSSNPGATIMYEGAPEALIASGIATEEMLSGSRPGRKRVDPVGRHFRLQRSFRIEDGVPVPHCKIQFSVPVEVIDQLPGAREAIYAGERLKRWYADLRDRDPATDSQSAAAATATILSRFARGPARRDLGASS
ncbi:MAG: hypothetical protein ACLQO1_01635 [Steroidobacteraceae bacterium]